MLCEQAAALIAARLDGELPESDRDALDAHLADCPDCRALAEAFRTQDADLRQAMEPRRAAAVATARRVIARVSPRRLRHPRLWAGAATLTTAAAALVLLIWKPWHTPTPDMPSPEQARGIAPSPIARLMPRPLPPAPPAPALAVGETVRTAAGERKRLRLPDGSVLCVNQNTSATLTDDRRLKLEAGEVYVEAVPATMLGDPSRRFVVEAPGRTVTALGTRFDVRADAGRSGVLVTQGQVELSGGALVLAGQELAFAAAKPTPAPRVSHELDWARDLIAAAESPLVPASAHAGGELRAVDPYGQEAKLALRKFHVDVHVEDGFARTTIDQTYFNHEHARLEGTFYFPLPADASLSRLAMYVDGNLMEGGMAERDYARQTYEKIVSSMRDPALLEWVDGTTFKMRVFPLEARQEKRIVLSYTQRLPVLYGRASYRFPAGHSLRSVDEWSFHALVRHGADLAWASPTHPGMTARKAGPDLVLDAAAKKAPVDRDVALELVEPSTGGTAAVRWSSAEHEGARYLMLRYRPDLPGSSERRRRDWVFLVETSADRDPLLARAQIELVRSLLANAEHDDTIAVLAAGTRAHAFAPAPVPNTPENAAAAVAFLEQAHLIGALDLGTAFDKARDLLAGAANPHLVHVGGGQAVIGDSRAAELVRRLPAGTRYVGVAVGKRWNRDLMKQSAERTGGYFTQVNPDEPLAWRGFDLLATLNTPRLFDVTVEPLANRRREPPVAASQQGAHAPRSPQFLGCAESLAQGEELCAMARVGPDAPALRLPEAVRVRGTLDGRPWEQVLPVEAVAPGADYLPRTWAKLEIDRLLAEDAARHKPAIIELSKAMYVMTPFTSLLVLENEQMYKEFKVDRGRKDHWAMYPCPPALNPKPAYEPDPNHPELTPAAVLRNGQKPHASRVMQSIVTRTPRSFLVDPSEAARRALEGMEDRFLGEQGEEFGLDLGLPSPVRFDSPIVTSTITATGLATTRAGQNLHFFATHDINGLGSRLDGTQPKTMWAVAPVMLGNGRVRDQREHMLFEGLNDSGLEGRAVTSANPLTLDSDPILIAIARDTLAKARKQAIYAEAANSKKYLAAVDFAEQNNDLYFLATNGPADGLHLGMIEGKPRATLGFMNGPSGVVTGITPAGFGGPNGFTSDLDIPLHSSSFNYAVPPFGGFPNSPRRNGAPPLYHRPEFSNDARIFSDLPSYAPGLNTSRADVAAAVEAEAAPRFGARLGRVDPAARALIDAARRGTWQTVTVPAGGLPLTILCDGAGRFTYERTLPLGLREQVVCDGTTLWHLYPEIGLAARRSVSRFHRAEFAAVVPTVVPPADDLAHGADVLPGPDGRTVVIRPHLLADADGNQRPAPVELHLVFADAGSLAERRLVEAATGKPLLTEQYRADGIVLLDAAGKEVRRRAFPRGLGLMPDLRPDTAGLVVVPMPFRSREHVYARLDMVVNQSLTGGVNGCFEYLPPGKALDLFVAECAAGEGGRARDVFRGCFEQKDDRRLGFYTLLAMAGHSFDDDPDALRELASHADSPLARYLGLHALPLNQFFQQTLGLTPPASADQDGSLLRRLLVFRSLLWRWSREPGWADLLTRDADARRGLAFVARHRTSPLGWALLGKMQDHGGTPEFFRGLAAEWAELAKVSPYPYAARYERANCLAAGGNRADAVREFQALYGQALAAGVLPPLNSVLRSVLQGQPGDSDEWAVLMRRTAEQLIAAGRRPAAVRLAWQCQTVGDAPLAENLVRLALTGDLPPDERRQTTLAALEFRWATEQLAEAEQLLQSLLTDSELAKVPALWRLASTLADRRGNEPGSLAALETALDLEYAHLPESVAVEPLRRDYAQLLGHYQKLAGAAAELHTKPPADLAARAVRAADRWRALDPEKETVCNLAAGVLRSLGERELAWDYQTTPRAGQPTEAGHWLGTAQGFRKQGDADLAERAFAAATATDPDHAEALWERAQNLRQAGRTDEADRLLRRLADQDWPAARGIREQARWWLQGK